MPFQQWILIYIPTWIILSAMLLVALGISVGGVLLVRRYVGVANLKHHHDIASPIFSTAGVIYAVLLGFVLIVVWQNFDKAQDNIINESNTYADIYRDLVAIPEPYRSQAKESVKKYVNSIIKDEWSCMAAGKRSLSVQELGTQSWAFMASFEPTTESQKAFYTEILRRMNDAAQMRRQRIVDASSGVHPVLWAVLLLGGIITVALTFFFGTERLSAQLTMTTLLSVLIVLILFTILIMDFPFSGDLSISPQAFKEVLMYMK
jgi:hypothetical protein